MAFLWKHPKSKYYIARFFDLAGKRRNRSTQSTNRKEAQRIAEAYEVAAKKRRTARQVRDVILELHKEICGEDLPSVSFVSFVESWLNRKAPEVSAATLSFYKNTAMKFASYLGTRATLEMTELTADDVLGFRNREAKTLAPKTVNHDLKCLRMLFSAARRDKVISEDPSEFVSATKKLQTKIRRPFSVPELQAALTVADAEWQSMIRFGLYTGQRLGDLAMLTWQNVDLIKGQIRLVTRKTGKVLILPIAEPLMAFLMSLPSVDNPETPVHPRAFAIVERQGKSGNLSNQFADILAAAGLRQKKTHRKTTSDGVGRGVGSGTGGLSFHCLRHTAVTLMKEAGIPEAVVMELVGHDSEQMSQHYTHVGAEALRKAAAALPKL